MSEREKIRFTVRRMRRTKRWQVLLDFLVVGLFWGAIPAALAILASRIWAIPLSEYWLAGGLLAATAIGFVVASFFVRLTPLEVANDIDVSLGLRERVSSALALDEGRTARDPFVKTLVKDAAAKVDGLPLKKVYPWGLPPAWKLALPAIIIACAMVFVPQLNLFASEEDREEIKLVQDQGKKLMELAEKLEEDAEKKPDPLIKEQSEEIKRVGEKLNRGNVKKKEALKELQRLKEKLESQANTRVMEGEKKLLAELGKELSKLSTTKELGEMLSEGDLKGLLAKLDELAESLMQGQLSPEQAKMLEDMLKALEEALKSDAANNPQAQALKQNLEELKQAMQQNQQAQQQMQSALDALEKDVNNLTQQMQQDGMGQESQQLQQQMQQLQQQMQQNGAVNPQSLQQMKQMLEQNQQAIDGNQSLSQQQQQQLSQLNQQALQHFEQKESG
jgi:hypothetical protein